SSRRYGARGRSRNQRRTALHAEFRAGLSLVTAVGTFHRGSSVAWSRDARPRSRKQTDPAAAAGKLMRNNFEAAEMSYGSSAAMDAVYMLGCSVAMSGPDLLGDTRPLSRPCAAHGLHLH